MPLYAEPVIMLQGDDPDCHVSFPVPLLVAISPLVRNILSDDHLPPAFSTPVISIPSLSVDILESVREILVSGMASMDMTRLCGVRELFRMIGIEDRMVLSVDTVGEEVCRKMEDYLDISENLMNLEECVEDDQTDGAVHNLSKKDNDGNVGCDDLETDVLKTLVGIKSEEHVQDCSGQIKSEIANIEILVKLEKVENPVFLLHHDEQSSHQFDEESQILSTQEELLKTSNSVAKQVKVSMARLKHADSPEECIDDLTVDENQDTSEKEVSFSPSSQKKCVPTKESVPKCDKIVSRLHRHRRNVKNKETAQCPHCDKNMHHSFMNQHILTVHKQFTKECLHCFKKNSSGSHFYRHIRTVHGYKLAQCSHCEKKLAEYDLAKHMRKDHKVKTNRLEGQPKRPMTAYFLWMNEEGRAMVKGKNPKASITEVAKKCGEEWREMDGTAKAKFERMNKEAKEKYDGDYKEWLEDGGEELLKQQKKDAKSAKAKSAAKAKAKKKAAKESSEDEVSEDEDSD